MKDIQTKAETIARESIQIAGRLCIYSNDHVTIETLGE